MSTNIDADEMVAPEGDAGAAVYGVDTVVSAVPAICAALCAHTGHDFLGYKVGTLVRRIRRRMQATGSPSAASYVHLIERSEPEGQALLHELLISVTEFFRDPEAFAALSREVIAGLFAHEGGTVRAWVCGCATGEEAYSLAMLLHEHRDGAASARQIQVFATDVDGEALATAREGRYGPDIQHRVSPERLSRFFSPDNDGWRVRKELRDLCLFTPHSVVKDPPFSSLDIVSCRNVLIYLGGDLQRRLVPVFHFALRPGGALFLGPTEEIAAYAELFRPLDARHRIFRRQDGVARPLLDLPAWTPVTHAPPRGAPPRRDDGAATQLVSHAFERMMLQEYAPASAVVNASGEILCVAGRTAKYLQPPAGMLSRNILDQAPQALRNALRAGLRAVAARGDEVVRDEVKLDDDGRRARVRVTVRALPGMPVGSGLFAVLIQEMITESAATGTGSAPPTESALVEQLEGELRALRSELQATNDELSTMNQEFRSANEELSSINEELSAANEELSAANEELCASQDQLRALNDALQASEGRYRSLFDSMTQGFALHEIVCDAGGAPCDYRFLDLNTAFERLTGLTRAQVVGRLLSEVLPREADRGPWVEKYGRVALEGTPVRFAAPSMELGRHYEVYAYRPAPRQFAVVFIDVTESERAAEVLRETDRRKNEFLALLSHELRNPLAPIRNSLYLLDHTTPGSEKALHARDVIERQVAQLTRLVDDLLDVTRIGSGKVRLQRAQHRLDELLARCLDDHRSLLASAGLRLTAPRDPPALWIDADAARVTQVVGNLLHNCAKFTPSGGHVEVTLDAEGDHAVLRVRDDGEGIAPEFRARVFEAFAQGDRSLDRRRGGLGLGLALVKGLVEEHGGTVSAHSDGPGLGSTFEVRLPLARSAAPRAPASVAPAVAARLSHRVLVVDDIADIADTLRLVLELMGHEVETASSGTEAVEKARRFSPRIMLCDLGLPGMNGYEVAAVVRADPALASMYLVALSGYAAPDDRRRALRVGFDRHMAKPIDFDELERVIAGVPASEA